MIKLINFINDRDKLIIIGTLTDMTAAANKQCNKYVK